MDCQEQYHALSSLDLLPLAHVPRSVLSKVIQLWSIGSLTSCSRCSARSRLIFSSSLRSSAVSSSSSSLLLFMRVIHTQGHGYYYLSASLLSLDDPSESASISLVSSNILRLFESRSSSRVPSGPGAASSCLLLGVAFSSPTDSIVGEPPLVLAKWAASASRS